jgi:hypothetical protein
MTIIHSFKYTYGGLGDLLRSMFAYYIYCQRECIEYYLDFSRTNLKYCFNNKVPESYNGTPFEIFKQIGSSSTQETFEFLGLIKDNPERNIIIYSNIFDFISKKDFVKYRSEFSEFLELSDPVKRRIRILLESAGIHDNNYASVHLRCGDAHMNEINVSCDSRMDPNESLESIINNCVSFVRRFASGHEMSNSGSLTVSGPIILFTDNQKVKNLYIKDSVKKEEKGIIVLDTTIRHTTLPTNGPEELSSIIDAVAEFYIMGNSKVTISIIDSGFSYWSSQIYGSELYKYNTKSDSVEKFDNLKY